MMRGFIFVVVFAVTLPMGLFIPTPLVEDLTINLNFNESPKVSTRSGHETFDDDEELKTGQAEETIVVVVGGEDSKGNTMKSSQFYKTEQSGWENMKNDMDTPRAYMGLASSPRSGLIVMAGGKDEGDDPLDSVYIRSLDGYWKPFTDPKLNHARMFNTLTVVDLNVIEPIRTYIVTGGRNKDKRAMNSTEIFQPNVGWITGKKWDMIYPRFGHAAVVFNSKLYALGGYGPYQENTITTEFFERTSKIWVRGPKMTQQRVFSAAATMDNFIYICGGLIGGGVYLNSCERGNNGGFQNTIEPMNEKRAYFGMVAMDDRTIWAIGGYNGVKVLDSMEKYYIDVDLWTTDDAKLTPPRNFFGVTTMVLSVTNRRELESDTRIFNSTKV